MAVIRLTKEFSFEAAHVLDGYNGLCSQIHGHSYRLFVTVVGEPEAHPAHPHYGMVIDFRVLKGIVKANVTDVYDHSLVIRDSETNGKVIEALRERFERIILVDYQPTCENMIVDIAEALRRKLPRGVELCSVRLHETASSFAEWFAADNREDS